MKKYLFVLVCLSCVREKIVYKKDPGALPSPQGANRLDQNFLLEWDQPNSYKVPSSNDPFLQSVVKYMENPLKPLFDLPDEALIIDSQTPDRRAISKFFEESYERALVTSKRLKLLYNLPADKFLAREHGQDLKEKLLMRVFVPLLNQQMYPNYEGEMTITEDWYDSLNALNLNAPNDFSSEDLVSNVFQPKTLGGDFSLRYVLSHAPVRSDYRAKRLEILKALQKNPEFNEKMVSLIDDFKNHEKNVLLSILGILDWISYDSGERDRRKPVLTEALNSTSTIPLFNIGIPADSSIFAYQVMQLVSMGGRSTVSALFSAFSTKLLQVGALATSTGNMNLKDLFFRQGILSNVLPIVISLFSAIPAYGEKVDSIEQMNKYIQSIQKLTQLILSFQALMKTSPELQRQIPLFLKPFDDFFKEVKSDPVFKEFIGLILSEKPIPNKLKLAIPFFQDGAKIIKLTSLTLRYYRVLLDTLANIYVLDAFSSVVSLMNSTKESSNGNQWAFGEKVVPINLKSQRRLGRFFFKNLFHPMLPPEQAVSNTIGSASHPTYNPQSKILLYAANSSGKSLFQEAIAYAHVLLEFLGVGPFHSESFASIPDIFVINRGVAGGNIVEGESFFVRELKVNTKARRYYMKLHADPTKTALVLIDEIYRGTSAIASSQLALAMLRGEQLSIPVNLILSTHNKPILFALPKNEKHILALKFPIEIQQEKLVRMTYRSEPLMLTERDLLSSGGADWYTSENLAPLTLSTRATGDDSLARLARNYLWTISQFYDSRLEKMYQKKD
jgi:hypothetical protein